MGLPGEEPVDGPSRVTFDIEPYGEIVRLTVTHENLADEADRDDAAGGWAAVLSNLKTLIETGHVLPQAPWDPEAPWMPQR
ncbi:MAG: SRPBCC domain-containing protein [Geodermatophilaceae bacterium]